MMSFKGFHAEVLSSNWDPENWRFSAWDVIVEKLREFMGFMCLGSSKVFERNWIFQLNGKFVKILSWKSSQPLIKSKLIER